MSIHHSLSKLQVAHEREHHQLCSMIHQPKETLNHSKKEREEINYNNDTKSSDPQEISS